MLIEDPVGLGGRTQKAALRLHETFPEAKVIIVLREQVSSIISSYRFFIQAGYVKDVESFINSSIVNPSGASYSRIDHLYYDKIISLYYDLFGEGNVKVLLFEMLKENPLRLCQEFMEFAGSDSHISEIDVKPQNSGLRAGGLLTQRLFNFVVQPSRQEGVPCPLSWLVACKLSTEVDKFLPKAAIARLEKNLKSKVCSLVGDTFAQSNRRASSLAKIDLSQYGYG